MWMNEYEIADAAVQFRHSDPVIEAATLTLVNLVNWTNRNSDGWPYWRKPVVAAIKLMDLIQEAQKVRPSSDLEVLNFKTAYKRALVPLKAFRTRHGADFEIVEV